MRRPARSNDTVFTRRRGERGQAAVETALTLPLTVFLILGTLQLFMILQARVLAQYATGRAVRAGSLHHGNCDVIQQTAIAAWVPAFKSFAQPTPGAVTRYKNIVSRAIANRFSPTDIANQTGAIVWLYRDTPTVGSIPANIEDVWNLPPPEGQMWELGIRVVFWYPMTIPFANWVVARAMLAHLGLADYTAQNPLLLSEQANWQKGAAVTAPPPDVSAELLRRIQAEEYVVPIQTTSLMRMMTPPRARYFNAACPIPAP